jgi:hypothetical protein
MCGLVGLVSKRKHGFTKDQQEVFSSLLFVDYLRGMDSTGIFLIRNNGDVKIAKEASNPIDFMAAPAYEEIMKAAWNNGSAIIGHNRKATRGNVNDENAHPFNVDDKLILVHNGTMFGDHKKIADVEVDSHAIAHALQEHGDGDGDIAEALGSFDAAYALIWYDFEAGVLKMVRNNARPLWWIETKDEWIWSSERSMLNFVKDRHNLVPVDGPKELGVDTLQKFKLLSGGNWDAQFNQLQIRRKATQYQVDYSAFSHSSRRRHPYDSGTIQTSAINDGALAEYYRSQQSQWPDEFGEGGSEFNDIPFDRQLEQVETVKQTSKTTSEFERKLAESSNKIITNHEFAKTVADNYPPGSTVHCIAFDYCFANQVDATGGFYLYSFVADDQDVIVRQHVDSKRVTEERMLQIAGTGYVHKMTVGTRMWASFTQTYNQDGPTKGYAMIHSTKFELVYGGGVGSADWFDKAQGRMVQ